MLCEILFPTRAGSAAKNVKQAATAFRAETSSPTSKVSERLIPSLLVEGEEEKEEMDGRLPPPDDSEDETEVEQGDQVIVQNSSQFARQNREEDKKNMEAGASQVPETIMRLRQIVNGQDENDESPTLRRSILQSPVETLRRSQASARKVTKEPVFVASPTVAVANSQPDQQPLGKLASLLSEPARSFLDGSHFSSPLVDATQIESPTHHTEADHPNFNSQIAEVDIADEQQVEKGTASNEHLLLNKQTSALPIKEVVTIASDKNPGENQRVGYDSTIEETVSVKGPTTNGEHVSMNTSPSVSGIVAQQQSSKYETAPTHASSSTPVPRPLNALFSSPSGRKRKRLGDIAAQPSPKKSTGETDVDEVMAAMDDSAFYNAVGNAPGSSSPIPPGRKSKRPRLMDRLAVSSRAASASTESNLPSSPPTSGVSSAGQRIDQAPTVISSSTRLRPPRRTEAIWDVQTSPLSQSLQGQLGTLPRSLYNLLLRHQRNKSRSVWGPR